MEQRLPVSLVIPTYNMVEPLERLLEAIKPLQRQLSEVVVVDDGSADRTAELVKAQSEIRLVRTPKNLGRFAARLLGAREAKAEWVLFLDTRVLPLSGFLEALKKNLDQRTPCVGWVEIDPSKNIFCLYWLRSHQFIFANHYRLPPEGVSLSMENYDRFLKGTGVYLCGRINFIDTCAELESENILSDDTLVLKKMLARESLRIDPNLKVLWEPRSSSREFLARLVERGPGFVEYHVIKRHGVFFALVLIGLVALILWFVLFFWNPKSAGLAAAGALTGIGLSTSLFARSPREFAKMFPLHIAVVFAFGSGVLYGLGYHLGKALGPKHDPSIESQISRKK